MSLQGFFSLFWISIFIFTVRVYVRGIETSGRPLNFRFATMFSQDAVMLAISDAVLVLCTGLCVPLAHALKKRWINYYWTGLVLQHLLQTSILFTAIIWTFNRQVRLFQRSSMMQTIILQGMAMGSIRLPYFALPRTSYLYNFITCDLILFNRL